MRSLRELVEETQETKACAQRFLDRFASICTPAIVVFSLRALAFSRNVESALTFLGIACPGALLISTPVSVVAGRATAPGTACSSGAGTNLNKCPSSTRWSWTIPDRSPRASRG